MPSFWDRTKKYVNATASKAKAKYDETASKAKAKYAAAKTKHYDCPARKSKIADLMGAEMKSVGYGYVFDGMGMLAIEDPQMKPIMEELVRETAANHGPLAEVLARAWMRGEVAQDESIFMSLADHVKEVKESFDKELLKSLKAYIKDQSFNQLRNICKCTDRCSERFKTECDAQALGGQEDCE